jgi:myo-inositol 2-dehydrogenase/D-chiro-inositol 1-dehydrogenase
MVNFVLFGAGRIGVMHAANIAAHPEASLAYVYDVDRLAAERVAAKYGAKIADSAEAALADKSVDAALIASSTNTHIDLITASALAGKAVLCEKPLDLDIGRVEIAEKRSPASTRGSSLASIGVTIAAIARSPRRFKTAGLATSNF